MENQQPRMLAAFAHPDDETFGAGGTLALYAARGVHLTLVCATRGEAGEISDPQLASSDNLGEVRELELRCAAESIGVGELIFLGYQDSGMAGTPQNQAENTYINIPDEDVVIQLVKIIRRVRPHIILTFGPDGIYGHPDHIKIHENTTAAFFTAADPDFLPEAGSAWSASRLFYNTISRSFVENLKKTMSDLGSEDSFQGFTGWPDEKIQVVMDISENVGEKWNALNCHRTQLSPQNPFRRVSEETARNILSCEFFVQAWPEPAKEKKMNDLFQDLEVK